MHYLLLLPLCDQLDVDRGPEDEEQIEVNLSSNFDPVAKCFSLVDIGSTEITHGPSMSSSYRIELLVFVHFQNC